MPYHILLPFLVTFSLNLFSNILSQFSNLKFCVSALLSFIWQRHGK